MVEALTAAVQYPQIERTPPREGLLSKEYALKAAAMLAVILASAMIVDGMANRNRGETLVGGVILGVAIYKLLNSNR